MNQIIVDEQFRAKLTSLAEPLELCDESGRILGLFYPAANGSHDDDVEPPISAEELARRSQERGGRTLAEIMADLAEVKRQAREKTGGSTTQNSR
jgi:hypothetical protein